MGVRSVGSTCSPCCHTVSVLPYDSSFPCLQNSGRCSSLDPIEHVGRMAPPSSHAEPLRLEQPAQVSSPNRFLVTADELGDFERRNEPIRQSVVAASCVDVWRRTACSMLRFLVCVVSHDVLRTL